MRICKYCNQEKEKFASKYICCDCKYLRWKSKHPYDLEKDKEQRRKREELLKETDPERYYRHKEERKKILRERARKKRAEKLEKDKLEHPEKYVVLSKEEKRQLKNEYAKEYRENHKEKISKKCKKWREENREYNKQKHKEYYLKHKERDRERKNKYQYERLQKDPQEKLKALLRTRVNSGFRLFSKNGKTTSCAEYGIDFKAIYDRIGPRPSDEYHLDHIIPISLFNYDIREHVRLSNCPENLRWVRGEINLSKADNIIFELIINEPILVDICRMLNIEINTLNGDV